MCTNLVPCYKFSCGLDMIFSLQSFCYKSGSSEAYLQCDENYYDPAEGLPLKTFFHTRYMETLSLHWVLYERFDGGLSQCIARRTRLHEGHTSDGV